MDEFGESDARRVEGTPVKYSGMSVSGEISDSRWIKTVYGDKLS
jgi:hypothetical protein